MKPQGRAVKVKPVCRKTEADPEGRRSLTELKGWRDGAWLKAQKSMVARRKMVPGGAKGARNQGRADWSTGRGGVMGMEVRGGPRGSTHQDKAGEQEVQGRSELLRGASGDSVEELGSTGKGL